MVSGLVSFADLLGIALGVGLFGSIFKNFPEWFIVSVITGFMGLLCSSFFLFPETPADSPSLPILGNPARNMGPIDDKVEGSMFSDEDDLEKHKRKDNSKTSSFPFLPKQVFEKFLQKKNRKNCSWTS